MRARAHTHTPVCARARAHTHTHTHTHTLAMIVTGEREGEHGLIVTRGHAQTAGKTPSDDQSSPLHHATPTQTRESHRPHSKSAVVCLFVGCFTSQQHASVSQGRIRLDNFTGCHTETDIADPTFHLTQSQYTNTGPTSPSADDITPGAWQGSHWSANFEVTGMTRPQKNPVASGIRTRDLQLSWRTPYH